MVTIIIILLIYVCMIFAVKYRTAIAILGVGGLLIYVSIFEGYSTEVAFKSFPLEIVLLILALALFSKIFENNGFLEVMGDKLLDMSKNKKILIAILLPFSMYAISLFMNNLSVVLIFTFISLAIIRKLKFPAIPILVAGLISSNIGGCPLPWADTPAVILTLYSDFTLLDFLSKLFIPCLIFEVMLIVYIFVWCKLSSVYSNVACFSENGSLGGESKKGLFIIKADKVPPLPEGEKREPPPEHELPPHIKMYMPKTKFKRVYFPLLVFLLFIISICVAPFIQISIAYICMFFIGFALILLVHNPIETLNSLGVTDSLVFISALFMIADVLKQLGLLRAAVDYIISFTNDDKILIILCVFLCAFVISTFLSAGPAAATVLPICVQLQPVIGSKFIYAALALGILSGSSMLPWSATGGPIMLSEVTRYMTHHEVCDEEKNNIEKIFDLKKYVLFSIPFSFIMVILSSIYLIAAVSL